MIETDILFAHIKEKDWLKETSDKLLLSISNGKLGTVHASRESLHELYYLSAEIGWSARESLSKIGALTRIQNLNWTKTTSDTDLLALSLIATHNLTSVFDAYHAAACLLDDPEHTIVSTDRVYDQITSLKRLEPKTLIQKP
jgi:predicted nucleic acid-binding protein